jgi:glutamyl-tRNA synthetase
VKPYFTKAGYSVDDEKLLKMMPIIRERLVTLDDAIPFGGFFFTDEISPDPQELIGKDMDALASAEILRQIYALIESLPEFSKDTLEMQIRSLVEERGLGVGQAFGIVRMAVTGQRVSPPLIESMEIIGRDKVLQRIKNAIVFLEELERKKD